MIISTGGTISSRLVDGCRRLCTDNSDATIITNFLKNEKYASLTGGIFENSGFGNKTLSENMTFSKLEKLISHIKGFDLKAFSGVIILHGTDTLAYTSALLSLVLSDTPVPVMLVSGDAPPDMEKSNANANFEKAVELILSGIAPNIYAPYRNADGRMTVHLGSRLMQSPNFTSDFFSAKKVDESEFEKISRARKPLPKEIEFLSPSALLINPYVNLDYRAITLDEVLAVAHGTYHSGTFCTDEGRYSLVEFAKRCKKGSVSLFVAPCKLDEEQYETVFEALAEAEMTPVPMTTEMLYIKVTLALSMGLRGEEIKGFVLTEYNAEMI